VKSRWRKNRAQPSHADDWLITYADMITLLLCFFVILLIATVSKKDSAKTEPGSHIVREVVEEKQVPETVPELQTLPEALPPQQKTRDRLPEENRPFHAVDQSNDAAANLTDKTSARLDALPEQWQTMVDHLKNQNGVVIAQGDRITTLEISSGAFFGSGSATLSVEGKTILSDVAIKLKSDEFKDYQITVEGHTDDSPIGTVQFPSNWELSTARAAAVVHFFLEQGISAQKLRAAGYADTFPKAPNRDANGNPIPENQAQNRRVVIKLEKIDKAASGL
jgi:chemotaxis protein MotB